MYVTQKVIVTGRLINKDKTPLVGSQYVEIWYSTRGVLHYFGELRCTATGAYAVRIYVTGQYPNHQNWIFYVKHPTQGLEGYSLSTPKTILVHKMPTKIAGFYARYPMGNGYLAAAGKLTYYNPNDRAWKGLAGEPVSVVKREGGPLCFLHS